MDGKQIADEKRAPRTAPRMRSLLKNLAADDLSMALLELAQLSRADKGGRSDNGAQPTLLFSEDGRKLTDVCFGPDPKGCCPRSDASGAIPCTGAWLERTGWMFKVAEDARMCPLVALGLEAPGAGSFRAPPA
jgi:hypothetical protein